MWMQGRGINIYCPPAALQAMLDRALVCLSLTQMHMHRKRQVDKAYRVAQGNPRGTCNVGDSFSGALLFCRRFQH